MTRYPFRAASQKFLEVYVHVYSKATYAERARRLRRQAKDIEQLWDDKKISTTDPAKMTYEDIAVFHTLIKSRNLSPKGISHELSCLNRLCKFSGNVCVDTAIEKFPTLKGRGSRKRLPTVPYDIVQRILKEGVKKEMFTTIRSYAVMTANICAGLRTIEIENALRKNIDPEAGEIYIEIMKGHGTYGEPRTVPIQPDGLELLRKYLSIRDKNTKSLYLFPSTTHTQPLAANTIRQYKESVAKDIGYDLTFQAGRRTYGQWLIDDGVPIETVSIHMGHRSSKTTEKFYARQREADAIAKTRAIWEEKRKKAGEVSN